MQLKYKEFMSFQEASITCADTLLGIYVILSHELHIHARHNKQGV